MSEEPLLEDIGIVEECTFNLILNIAELFLDWLEDPKSVDIQAYRDSIHSQCDIVARSLRGVR